MKIEPKALARLEEVIERHKKSHPGQYVLMNVTNGTFVIAPNHRLAAKKYGARRYGTPLSRCWIEFMANTIPAEREYIITATLKDVAWPERRKK